MHKSLIALLILFFGAGMILSGYAAAQQTPAATNSQPASGQGASAQTPSTQAPAKAQSGTAAKKPAAPGAKTAAPLALKTQKEKESYAMGMNLGMGLHRQGMTLDPALVARGIRDAMTGAKTLITEDEARAAMQQLQNDAFQHVTATNRKEGDAFLTANKSKEGVVTLPSGLQYKILKAGTGPKPTASDTVTCNYRGTLINGTEFDSSYKRGQPASFPLGGVIKGWTEALQLMPVGSKWQLFIPADLAYGDHPPSRDIAPGSTLIFEVELLSVGEQKR
jgi:FKBP-type peptidyl-prolyl cis-trans isomerase FklB